MFYIFFLSSNMKAIHYKIHSLSVCKSCASLGFKYFGLAWQHFQILQIICEMGPLAGTLIAHKMYVYADLFTYISAYFSIGKKKYYADEKTTFLGCMWAWWSLFLRQ